jgi:hypothetical protein
MLKALATRESSLDSCEVTLEARQKILEDTHLMVITCELANDVRETNLDTRATELAEWEKWLAKKQMQDIAITQKRLEELQASRSGEARRV